MKLYNPTTSARRGMTRPDFSAITKNKPDKKLLGVLKKTGGRNDQGRITVRFRGGGVKRRYRFLEFGQKRLGESANVLSIEYDPNRTARIALIEYQDNKRSYIIAPDGLKVGQTISFGESTSVTTGNRLKLKNVPVGTFVYNIETNPGQGGKIARSAGSAAKVLATEGKYSTLSMPSGEIRKILSECFATVGFVSNRGHNLEVISKAGRVRHKGVRPHVRGKAMNAADHPHGGGEGRTTIGLKHPKTPWGKNAFGVKTRKKKKYSSKMIVQRRK